MKTKLLTIWLLLVTSQVFASDDMSGKKLLCIEQQNYVMRTYDFISSSKVIQKYYNVHGKIKSQKNNYGVEPRVIVIEGVIEPPESFYTHTVISRKTLKQTPSSGTKNLECWLDESDSKGLDQRAKDAIKVLIKDLKKGNKL